MASTLSTAAGKLSAAARYDMRKRGPPGWTNQRKHGVAFEDAIHVFEDPYALFQQDRTDEAGDLRWQALGLTGGVALLLVAHTVREEGEDEVIRLISAR